MKPHSERCCIKAQIKTTTNVNNDEGDVKLQQTKFTRVHSDGGFTCLKEIVLVGDTGVGKTMLLSRLKDTDYFDELHARTIYDRADFNVNINDVKHNVRIHDVNSEWELSLSRTSIYPNACCMVLCYAVNDHKTYENVIKHWSKEAKCFNKSLPMVLVATKIDLRNTRPGCVSTADGEKLSRQIGANKFVECSAKENIKVTAAMTEAIRAAVNGPIQPPPTPITVTDKKNKNSDNSCCCTIL